VDSEREKPLALPKVDIRPDTPNGSYQGIGLFIAKGKPT